MWELDLKVRRYVIRNTLRGSLDRSALIWPVWFCLKETSRITVMPQHDLFILSFLRWSHFTSSLIHYILGI